MNEIGRMKEKPIPEGYKDYRKSFPNKYRTPKR